MKLAVKGDYVEVVSSLASPQERAKQPPGTYPESFDKGYVVTESFEDEYGVEYHEVNIWKVDRWRRRRVRAEDLKVVPRLVGVPDSALPQKRQTHAPRHFGETA